MNDWVKARNKALLALDVDWALVNAGPSPFGAPPTREVMLIALHKARYECPDMPAEARHSSGAWLRERGYGWRVGPLLPEGELP